MSEKKILETLEKNPAGLSISEIAEQSKLHRNTVTTVIKKLQENRKVEFKKLGLAKVYYLKKYSGLHRSEGGYKGKNISVGIGISDLQNGYQAAISAAKQAAMQSSKGKKPSFSLVFVSSKYNPKIKEVVKGINIILGNNWIGCTTDKELNSIIGYSEGTIEVLCIDTKYMHFGIGISEDYRKNPAEEAKKATMKAIENCPAERSRFATAQFMRGTKKGFAELVKNPPYFVLTFIGGSYFINRKLVPGAEVEFLDGIKDYIGLYIPILGGSAASNFEGILNYEGENYVFANGKYYKDGAVVCFVVSELYFSHSLEHGYIPIDKYGVITKVSGKGRIIEEINNKSAIDEYCRLIGINKKEFIKNPFQYTTANPICILNQLGNISPKVTLPLTPKPSETKLAGSERFLLNTSFVIGQYNEKKTVEATKAAIEEAYKEHEDKNIVLALNFNCAVRRFLLKEKIEEEILNAKKILSPNSLLFGFSTFGEIGAKRNQPSSYNNITSTVLLIFDKLQIE